MKHVGTEYEVKFLLSFTEAEVKLLSECAQRHYDYRCRATDDRGFINALRHVAREGISEYMFDRYTLDLACKVTETCFFSNQPEAFSLHYALKRYLKALDDEMAAKNKV